MNVQQFSLRIISNSTLGIRYRCPRFQRAARRVQDSQHLAFRMVIHNTIQYAGVLLTFNPTPRRVHRVCLERLSLCLATRLMSGTGQGLQLPATATATAANWCAPIVVACRCFIYLISLRLRPNDYGRRINGTYTWCLRTLQPPSAYTFQDHLGITYHLTSGKRS